MNTWSDSSGAIDFQKKEWPIWPTDFEWSFWGELEGFICLEWVEPLDASWKDNFLCWPEQFGDIGFEWHTSGLNDVGESYLDYMKCEWVYEPTDNNGWSEEGNYLCVPRNTPYKFDWLTNLFTHPKGWDYNYGTDCINIVESLKQGDENWLHNYLCAFPVVTEHACVPCQEGLVSDAGSSSIDACAEPVLMCHNQEYDQDVMKCCEQESVSGYLVNHGVVCPEDCEARWEGLEYHTCGNDCTNVMCEHRFFGHSADCSFGCIQA